MSGRRTADERGVALGLAVIMVALIGVLAAGLLTFVAADLEAVAEANRGRQAFELAEAGIEVAKAHLAEDPSDWSSGELHMEDAGENAVAVTVERDGEGSLFIATSTGEYGGSTRKIEAVYSIGEDGLELVRWRELYE